jgi:hypothetical protein
MFVHVLNVIYVHVLSVMFVHVLSVMIFIDLRDMYAQCACSECHVRSECLFTKCMSWGYNLCLFLYPTITYYDSVDSESANFFKIVNALIVLFMEAPTSYNFINWLSTNVLLVLEVEFFIKVCTSASTSVH